MPCEWRGRARLHAHAAGPDRRFRKPLWTDQRMNIEINNKKIMKIAVLGGDGIGPEVTAQSIKVLRALEGGGLAFQLTEAPIGQAGVDAAGVPLPDETLALAAKSDAILFGAVGAPTH